MSQYSTSSILGGSSAPAVERSNPARRCLATEAGTVPTWESVEIAPETNKSWVFCMLCCAKHPCTNNEKNKVPPEEWGHLVLLCVIY